MHYLFNTNRQTPTKPHTKYSSYTAPTPLDIRQEVEQIKAKVFYSTFLNVFLIFSRTFFYIYGQDAQFELHAFRNGQSVKSL